MQIGEHCILPHGLSDYMIKKIRDCKTIDEFFSIIDKQNKICAIRLQREKKGRGVE
jgi:nitrate/TMAO reductase-like tetraheme cytochrome c subunit